MNKKSGYLNQALEQAVLEKLRQEWRLSVLTLGKREPSLVSRMKRPGIVISDMEKTLGLWDPSLKEIRIARYLVHEGRWDSVVEVLRHEMAHQLASTFPESVHETAHGPLFTACCKLLNANPKASGSYRTLEQRVWSEDGEDDDRIMVKVKKLMALAESKNPHEAALAAAKAGELIARYNVQTMESKKTRQFESIIITPATLKRSQAQILAALIVDQHYFVESVWVPVYLPEKKKMGMALEISGTRSNLKIADYVFDFVLNYARKSWIKYKAMNPACRSRSGYMTGVVNGFRETLDWKKSSAAKPRDSNSGTALLLPRDSQLDAYVGDRYPGLKRSGIYHGSTSRDAYNSGLSKGRNLVVSRAVTSNDGDSGRLLGQ